MLDIFESILLESLDCYIPMLFISLFLGVIGIVILAPGLYFVAKAFFKKFWSLLIGSILIAPIITVIIGITISFHHDGRRTIYAQVMLVAENESGELEIVSRFPEETRVWNDDFALWDGELMWYKQERIHIWMNVSHITDNSEIRHLNYNVYLDIRGTPEKALTLYKVEQKTGRSCGEQIEWYLHEFNKEYGQELVKFYNPQDDGQQEEFCQIIRDYLVDYCAEAEITFVEASFEILDPSPK